MPATRSSSSAASSNTGNYPSRGTVTQTPSRPTPSQQTYSANHPAPSTYSGGGLSHPSPSEQTYSGNHPTQSTFSSGGGGSSTHPSPSEQTYSSNHPTQSAFGGSSTHPSPSQQTYSANNPQSKSSTWASSIGSTARNIASSISSAFSPGGGSGLFSGPSQSQPLAQSPAFGNVSSGIAPSGGLDATSSSDALANPYGGMASFAPPTAPSSANGIAQKSVPSPALAGGGYFSDLSSPSKPAAQLSGGAGQDILASQVPEHLAENYGQYGNIKAGLEGYNFASQMTPDNTTLAHNINAVTNAANKYGMDQNTALTMANRESSMKANAINSIGASGLFQFVPAKHGGAMEQYGLNNTNKFNAEANADAGVRFMRDNINALQAKGINPSVGSIYGSHLLGPAGFGSVATANPNALFSKTYVSPARAAQVAQQNDFIKPGMTNAQAIGAINTFVAKSGPIGTAQPTQSATAYAQSLPNSTPASAMTNASFTSPVRSTPVASSPSASQLAKNYGAYRPSQGASAASTSVAASVPDPAKARPADWFQSKYQGVTDPLASERVAPRFGTMPDDTAYVQYNGAHIPVKDNFYSPQVQNFSNNPKDFTPHNVVMHYTAGAINQSPQSIKNAALGRYTADGIKSGTNFGVGIDPVTGGVAIQHYAPYGTAVPHIGAGNIDKSKNAVNVHNSYGIEMAAGTSINDRPATPVSEAGMRLAGYLHARDKTSPTNTFGHGELTDVNHRDVREGLAEAASLRAPGTDFGSTPSAVAAQVATGPAMRTAGYVGSGQSPGVTGRNFASYSPRSAAPSPAFSNPHIETAAYTPPPQPQPAALPARVDPAILAAQMNAYRPGGGFSQTMVAGRPDVPVGSFPRAAFQTTVAGRHDVPVGSFPAAFQTTVAGRPGFPSKNVIHSAQMDGPNFRGSVPYGPPAPSQIMVAGRPDVPVGSFPAAFQTTVVGRPGFPSDNTFPMPGYSIASVNPGDSYPMQDPLSPQTFADAMRPSGYFSGQPSAPAQTTVAGRPDVPISSNLPYGVANVPVPSMPGNGATSWGRQMPNFANSVVASPAPYAPAQTSIVDAAQQLADAGVPGFVQAPSGYVPGYPGDMQTFRRTSMLDQMAMAQTPPALSSPYVQVGEPPGGLDPNGSEDYKNAWRGAPSVAPPPAPAPTPIPSDGMLKAPPAPTKQELEAYLKANPDPAGGLTDLGKKITHYIPPGPTVKYLNDTTKMAQDYLRDMYMSRKDGHLASNRDGGHSQPATAPVAAFAAAAPLPVATPSDGFLAALPGGGMTVATDDPSQTPHGDPYLEYIRLTQLAQLQAQQGAAFKEDHRYG